MLLQDAFNHQVKIAGTVIRVRYYTETIGSVYDDSRTLSYSGTDIYTSGIIQSLSGQKGSQDQVLMEQGRIKYGDSKIYVGSQIVTTSGAQIFTFSVSGLDKVYQEILPGMQQPQYFGNTFMNAVYVREITNGSIF